MRVRLRARADVFTMQDRTCLRADPAQSACIRRWTAKASSSMKTARQRLRKPTQRSAFAAASRSTGTRNDRRRVDPRGLRGSRVVAQDRPTRPGTPSSREPTLHRHRCGWAALERGALCDLCVHQLGTQVGPSAGRGACSLYLQRLHSHACQASRRAHPRLQL